MQFIVEHTYITLIALRLLKYIPFVLLRLTRAFHLCRPLANCIRDIALVGRKFGILIDRKKFFPFVSSNCLSFALQKTFYRFLGTSGLTCAKT